MIFDNSPQSDKAGQFEKKYRGDFKSGYSQQALAQAIKNLARVFEKIRNKLYDQTINSDDNNYLKFLSSRFLFKAAITGRCTKKLISEFKEITDNEPSRLQEKVLEMLENTSNQQLKLIKERLEFDFKEYLKTYKVPKQDKATVQLDSRTCDLEKSENIQAHYVLRVSVLDGSKRIEIPLLTSTNSLRRLNQYKYSKSPQLKIRKDGQIKVSVAFNKKVNDYAYKSQVVGIDVGITDLLFTSEGDNFETFSNMDDFYQKTVGKKLKNRRKLASKMKQYQKELNNNVISQKRKEYLKEKIYNISRTLQGTNQLERKRNQYHQKVREKISAAVKKVINKYKDKKVTIAIEDLDITEFDGNSNRNRKFSSWVRGKILSKLKEELDWHGIAYKEVDPAYTSKVCPNCHNLDDDNRSGKTFSCTVCNYEGDADHTGVINIKNRAFDKEIKNIANQYKYNTNKRHQKLREHYHQKHKKWLQNNPEHQEKKQLELAL